METIGSFSMWSFLDGSDQPQRAGNTVVREGPGHLVGSYLDLAKKVAELQFRNREWVLLFRGQNRDWPNREGNTSLKPSLFRSERNSTENPGEGTLSERFDVLKRAEGLLATRYTRERFLGADRLKRHRILRWSVIQHYEVCGTPLLDVTHSLRIAVSFATHKAAGEAFLYTLAVPNLSGAVTASSEAGIQTIRLASACPPCALRPHIQEGYLLGEYPEMGGYDQKQFYHHYEIDFGRRLIAKFRFNPGTFWEKTNFPVVSPEALYPNSDDPLYRLTQEVKAIVNPDPQPVHPQLSTINSPTINSPHQ